MQRVVHMSEDIEHDLHDGAWLTGRFSGVVEEGSSHETFDGLSLEDALAWARARANRVLIRYGDEPNVNYSAGTKPMADMPSWPPPQLPPLVRRRDPDDRWRDRTDADPAIVWLAEAEVVPPDVDSVSMSDLSRRRTDWRTAVAELARDAGAEWDSAPLDEFIADVTAAREEAGDAEEFGWFSFGAVALRIRIRVDASTASVAQDEATNRLRLAPGWRAEWTVRPDG